MSVMDASVATGTTISAIMQRAPLAQLEARILLAHVTQLSRVQLITQSERALTADEAQQLSQLFARRLAGEPIAYLTGEREFFGLSFDVSPAVLIPRPDTELLVELAIEHLPSQGRALDMGTGSGAIAIALAHARPDASVTALDVSTEALAIATSNARKNQVKADFLRSDWFSAVEAQRFDLIVSNPPYIVAGDPHLSEGDLRFEPVDALTDHGNGLSDLHTITRDARAYLAPGAWLLMEHGYDQAAAVREVLSAYGYTEVQSWRDLAGIERVSGGRYRADK
ncbi:MAG: peptide chain release factor N(5)-glutamine methyltransferase [Burkholderiaceae bacterium]|uniref:Release factor glutamine methyltransferase n=1 Tax=Herminiimonas contaminans TaxID=1111140 RepID=A0ABS0EWZ7_9BURK|nr:peptide chain release factor N(5)-glutamine methyltransferase [Herminiimonas contaminans]MBF8179363.1 peptide chain release factor N(5)-glutamine methyltransferase [Herminiimonas contaminans]MBX9799670.1 peptide chain release factor N(5)-glutamine methyltransferase [Burkholderiaceae bacterium]